MKLIRKILYVLLSLLALFCAVIVICAFRPDITKRMATLLYQDRDVTVDEDSDLSPDDDSEVSDVVYQYQPQSEDNNAQDVRKDSTKNDNPASSSERAESTARDTTATAGLRSDNATDYIAPDESEIAAPDNVSGKSGYQQIEEDAQQIGDEAADDIQNQLDYGYLGDDLSFDAVYYPYYNMLDNTGKHVYRQIYANANAVNPAFMPVEYVTSAELRNIFAAVYNDHPELFWLETAYSCKYISTGQCMEIDLKFNRTAQALDSAKEAFDEQVNDIMTGAQNLFDIYSIEKYVHDQLLDRVSYNARAEMNQSAYSALVNGQTVCAGYARAFQYIMRQFGVPCYYCTGFAGENHAWNIVRLSDGFYNVDTTWDDSDGGKYDYFNKTDEDYSSTHLRKELSVYLPPCNGQIFRNLEQGNEADENKSADSLRSLADVGIAEDQVITDIGRYYEDCYNRIVQNGLGTYTFDNVVASAQLCEEVERSYNSDGYWQAYMENAMSVVGASNCDWAVVWEPLQDGMYLLSHEVRLR